MYYHIHIMASCLSMPCIHDRKLRQLAHSNIYAQQHQRKIYFNSINSNNWGSNSRCTIDQHIVSTSSITTSPNLTQPNQWRQWCIAGNWTSLNDLQTKNKTDYVTDWSVIPVSVCREEECDTKNSKKREKKIYVNTSLTAVLGVTTKNVIE